MRRSLFTQSSVSSYESQSARVWYSESEFLKLPGWTRAWPWPVIRSPGRWHHEAPSWQPDGFPWRHPDLANFYTEFLHLSHDWQLEARGSSRGGLCDALYDVLQHLWPLPTRHQDHISLPPKVVTPKIVKRPPESKPIATCEPLLWSRPQAPVRELRVQKARNGRWY